ncbi:MAG: permease, partial [Alphaproteobacteria bacterium]
MTAVTLALRQMGGTLRRVDRVLLATAGLFALLALVVPAQAGDSVMFTLGALVFIAPFFAASVLVAACAKATGLDRQVATVFSGRPAVVIVLAAAFGAFSPFCSCGVVPIIAGLLAAGVPLAPVMAFWIASPLMDPEMFILMAAVLGLELTVAKTLAAFVIGLLAGFATQALVARAAFADPLKAAAKGCGGGCGGPALDASPEILWAFWRRRERRATFADEARATGWFLFKWLTLAFAIESLMVAYLPAETVGAWLGNDHWWVIPASVAVGVPAYLNGYAAIPTVDALLALGMAPGAALAFMVAGGVTSIPAAMAVFALVKRP